MSAAKHTPGPWLLRTTPTSAGLCHIVSAADWRGAFLYGDGIRRGVDDALPKAQELAANARLIAAAPEFLAESKALVETLRGMAIHPSHYEALVALVDRVEGAAA